jgi:hypothetical protein
MQSDWTVSETLEVVAAHCPGNQQRLLDDIRQNARLGKIKISGRRCVWRPLGRPTDVQEREEISPLMWVDIVLCRMAFEWAAANECELREFNAYQYHKIVRVGLRSNPEIRQGTRTVVPPKERTELRGWCRLRINSANVLAVFPTPMSPTPKLPSGVRTNKEASAEQACGTHLRNLNERPKNKDEAYVAAAAAVANVGQLSRNAFDRAWAKEVPADWKRAGARKDPRKSAPQ